MGNGGTDVGRRLRAVDPDERYRLLESVRFYGARRLAAAGEDDATRERFLRFYVEMCEHAAVALTEHGALDWVRRLDAEQPNLRVALDASMEPGPVDVALTMAWGLANYWYLHGHLAEGRRRIEDALTLPGGDPRRRAWALVGTSMLTGLSGPGRKFVVVSEPRRARIAPAAAAGPTRGLTGGHIQDTMAGESRARGLVVSGLRPPVVTFRTRWRVNGVLESSSCPGCAQGEAAARALPGAPRVLPGAHTHNVGVRVRLVDAKSTANFEPQALSLDRLAQRRYAEEVLSLTARLPEDVPEALGITGNESLRACALTCVAVSQGFLDPEKARATFEEAIATARSAQNLPCLALALG